MSSRYPPPSTSTPGSPPKAALSSAPTYMATTQLPPIAAHIVPRPSAVVNPGRPILPPLHPRPHSLSDASPHLSYPRPWGPPGPPLPGLGAYPRHTQQPATVPWNTVSSSERTPRSQPGTLPGSLPPMSSAYPPYGGMVRPSLYRNVSSGTSPEFPWTASTSSKTSSRGSQQSTDEEARQYASFIEQPSRRESGSSHLGSAASSSPYGSATSYLPQPRVATGFTSNSHEITSRYILRIRQQPIAARACGFGERDRRVIDPPPIAQLSLSGYDPKSPMDVAELRTNFLVVHCSLLSVPAHTSPYAQGEDITAVPEPNNSERLTRRLTGTLVSSPFAGTDLDMPPSRNEDARLGCFFIFPDLSCRQVGRYRLRFQIMRIVPELLVVGGSTNVVRSVDSDIFEVFSAKDFPGMRASTALTKDLKRQGAAVSVKKGNEGSARQSNKKRGSTGSDRSASDDSRGRSERTHGLPRRQKK